MIRFVAIFLTPIFLAGGGSTAAKDHVPLTAPLDTFVTGSELVLFGKEVPPTVHNGRSGYRVTKDDSTVSINGIVYFNTKTRPPTRIRPIDPEIQRKSNVLESAIKVVDSSRNDETGEITIDGKTYPNGEALLVSVPEHQVYASVRADKDGFEVQYEGLKLYCMRKKVVNEPLNPVNVSFQHVVKQLSGRRFVVMSRGYAFTCPISDAPRVRASLAKIPESAEVQLVDEYGRNFYKALTIDGYLWTNEVIRDIVEK